MYISLQSDSYFNQISMLLNMIKLEIAYGRFSFCMSEEKYIYIYC